MHFTISNKKELAKKVAFNVKVVEKNSLISSLSNIKLEVIDSKLILTSYDGNNCVVSSIDIENKSGVNGSVLIDMTSFKIIVDRLSLLESELIEFEMLEDNSEMSVKSNRTKLKIKTVLDTSDFEMVPSVEEFEDYKKVIFDRVELSKAVSNVAKCSAKDNVKPLLEAVNFVVEGNKCDVVALDGYKLALNVLSCESDNNFKISVSANKLNSVLKDIASHGEETVELKTNGKYTLIQSGAVNIFIREIEGSIAPYKKLLDKKFNYSLLINRDALSYVLNSSMMATSKDNKFVKMTVKPNDSTIEFNSKGDIISDFSDEIDMIITSVEEEEVLEIAFNSSYFVELVGNIESQNLKLYLKDATSPVYIENYEDDSDVYLVLPVRMYK